MESRGGCAAGRPLKSLSVLRHISGLLWNTFMLAGVTRQHSCASRLRLPDKHFLQYEYRLIPFNKHYGGVDIISV